MGSENLTSITEFILVGLTSHRKSQVLLFVILLLIYTFTVMGDLGIILLIWTDPHLHTPMYFFLMLFSGLEICYVTCSMPQMLAHLQAGNGAISFGRCTAQGYVSMCLGTVEFLLLGVMAYDRYLAICCPLVYAIAMDRGWQLLLASVSWAAGFFFALVYVGCILRHPYCVPNRINHFYCELPLVLKLACTDTCITETVIFVLAGLILAGPLAAILTSYTLILSTVLQMKSMAGRSKAFSTCSSHLLVATLFYGTVVFTYMRPRSSSAPDRDKQIAVFYVVITPLLNPIIYTLRKKDIHVAVAKTLRRCGAEHKRGT
ncbi:olfactory receptor 2G3-like [Eublepharis macularius]|uniref:Olfactory receptor n=1 Tax=Eublepharis macularius TaxID=481883 RepID=A0AA97K2G8_EUBMA|nr:olfactory receptor 2G3-like [Eublepharis macularius]